MGLSPSGAASEISSTPGSAGQGHWASLGATSLTPSSRRPQALPPHTSRVLGPEPSPRGPSLHALSLEAPGSARAQPKPGEQTVASDGLSGATHRRPEAMAAGPATVRACLSFHPQHRDPPGQRPPQGAEQVVSGSETSTPESESSHGFILLCVLGLKPGVPAQPSEPAALLPPALVSGVKPSLFLEHSFFQEAIPNGAQELLLADFRKPCRMLGIQPRSSTCKANTLPSELLLQLIQNILASPTRS